VAEGFLAERGIALLPVGRGEDITFHGPGEFVGYPIVDPRVNGWRVVDFGGARGADNPLSDGLGNQIGAKFHKSRCLG
jgi:hypothetical protein